MNAFSEQRIKLKSFISRGLATQLGENPELGADVGHAMSR